MAETGRYGRMLKGAGLRATAQRAAVLHVLSDAEDHPGAEEIATRAGGGTLSVATVYRALAALEGAGLVRRLSLETPARYELTPQGDHDHLVDMDSGEVVEIDLGDAGEEMARLRAEAAARLGYEIVSQHTVLRGRRRRRADA